jgi:hypothetical protein
MTAFWNDMAQHGWTERVPTGTVPPGALLTDETRAQARAEIEAVVAKHVYGIGRSELEYVIGTFTTLGRNEVRKYGEFRSERLVLDFFAKV